MKYTHGQRVLVQDKFSTNRWISGAINTKELNVPNAFFLCQDEVQGATCMEKFGFKYSYFLRYENTYPFTIKEYVPTIKQL